MASRFSVGDRVSVIAPESYIHGAEGIIREVNPAGWYDYYFQDSSGVWGVMEYELVKID